MVLSSSVCILLLEAEHSFINTQPLERQNVNQEVG
jgi:hypothetical protein